MNGVLADDGLPAIAEPQVADRCRSAEQAHVDLSARCLAIRQVSQRIVHFFLRNAGNDDVRPDEKGDAYRQQDADNDKRYFLSTFHNGLFLSK